MLVTPEGIVTLVNPLQLSKAKNPMLVTGFESMVVGMLFNAPVGFVTYPVIEMDVPVSV